MRHERNLLTPGPRRKPDRAAAIREAITCAAVVAFILAALVLMPGS